MEAQAVTNVIQTQCAAQLGKYHGRNMTRLRKGSRLHFMPGLQFSDKFSRNVLDYLPRHHHIMLLRSHVFVLFLMVEKKVTWDLFFVKSENFMGYLRDICAKSISFKLRPFAFAVLTEYIKRILIFLEMLHTK